MATSKKQINISTNLSNNNEVFSNYSDYRQSIICRYSNSNSNTLINPVFTTFIDSVTNNNDSTINIVDINNYKSKSPFNLIYNINKSLKRFDDLIFNNCTTLTGITHIPSSFKVIGRYAFNGCNSLTYINLPDTIDEVREFAFNGTNNLKNLDISNIYKIHNYSFAGASLDTFELNEKIKILYHYLFKDCQNMKQFINDNVELLGEGVFCGCTNLEYIELSNYHGVYETKDEYVETLENFGKRKSVYEIGKEYIIEFLDELGENVLFKGKIETIENISEDDFLFGLARFVITECDGDNNLIGKIFYVGFECFEDIDGEYFHHCYYEDGTSVTRFTIRLEQKQDDSGGIETEPNEYILYDCDDNMIGKITKQLYQLIKFYDDEHNHLLISSTRQNETLIIQFKNPIRYIEYYADGITPTGRVYDKPSYFQSYDDTQGIMKYKYYSQMEVTYQDSETGEMIEAIVNDIIQLTNNINVNLVFNDDFTECYIKLNGYPVYEASQLYIGYYMYEPFLSIRKEVDENFVEKEGSDGNAYVDNGLYVKYEGMVAKYPVYNINYCYLGNLNNGKWLEYTNQIEVDTYLSRLEEFIIVDEDGYDTEFRYFMLPSSYNYGESDITEDTIDATKAAIYEIINEIIEFKTGTNPEEEEENLRQFNKFDLNDLGYYSDKYDLPNMLFADCVKLSNNNIVKYGNYNSDLSHVNIKFTNQKDSKNTYIGEWQDVIGFNYYTPSNAAYNYVFKWKYLTYLDKDYICIILNDKTYFIIEEFDESTETYHRNLVDNIYGTPNIIEDFKCNALTISESIFKIDLFNKIYLIKLPNLQKKIYDKYYLLDTIENVGDNTFMNCSAIENITNKFKTIGSFAFKDCINLKSIELNRTENIGKFAFQNCTSLSEISLNYLTELKNEGVFYNCINLSKIHNLSLSEIPDQMFKNCYSLNNIKMNNINKVNDEAFYGCTSLVIDKLNKLNNIKYFGDYAFAECKNIKVIEFNGNIENLGKGVFKGCTSLENVELPSCINTLPSELFYGCKQLKSIKFNSTLEDIDLSGIDFCNNIESIHIPSGGRYITPDDSMIFDTETQTIIYICKNISVINITNIYNDGTEIGETINISNTAFNNCKVSIINISKDIYTPNINSNTFNGIKNETYHILIDKSDSKYDKYYELVGKNHIYYI